MRVAAARTALSLVPAMSRAHGDLALLAQRFEDG